MSYVMVAREIEFGVNHVGEERDGGRQNGQSPREQIHRLVGLVYINQSLQMVEGSIAGIQRILDAGQYFRSNLSILLISDLVIQSLSGHCVLDDACHID